MLAGRRTSAVTSQLDGTCHLRLTTDDVFVRSTGCLTFWPARQTQFVRVRDVVLLTQRVALIDASVDGAGSHSDEPLSLIHHWKPNIYRLFKQYS